MAAHEVDELATARDEAADDAEALAEATLHDVGLVEQARGLQQAAALRAVHADGMGLVDEGQRAVAPRDGQQLAQRRDVAVHRVQRFERHQLRPGRVERGESRLEVRGVAVREHDGFGAAAPDALDHRRVVVGVGQHHAPGQRAGEGREHRVVGDVAGGEHQRRVLAVQRREFRFERDDRVVGARDVAGATGAGAVARQREPARLEHQRVAAHAEVVVAAPDGDRAAHAVEGRERDRAGRQLAAELPEHAVAIFAPQAFQGFTEEAVVVEAAHPRPPVQCRPSARARRAP